MPVQARTLATTSNPGIHPRTQLVSCLAGFHDGKLGSERANQLMDDRGSNDNVKQDVADGRERRLLLKKKSKTDDNSTLRDEPGVHP